MTEVSKDMGDADKSARAAGAGAPEPQAYPPLDSIAIAGFTPGPWSFDGEPHNIIVWSSPEDRVCFLTSNGPAEANARLIAAAPALYEALAGWDRLHSDMVKAGGAREQLSEAEVARFAAVQSDLMDRTVAALKLARGNAS